MALRGAIRRIFTRSPIVREVLMKVRREVPRYNKDGTRAKKDAVQYQCNMCKQWVGSTHVSVDHHDPVIQPEVGFVDWDTFIARLFCRIENLQCLCDDCHQKKTNEERQRKITLQDTKTLDELEKQAKSKELFKQLKKFTSKTKPEAIRLRAQKLLSTF